MQAKSSLEAVIDSESRVLILGTLPGDESLRLRQYYADPVNQFWKILERVYDETVGTSYAEKLEFLRDKALALWDVLRRAERPGSLDRDIRHGIANSFGKLFEEYPALSTVVFNGSKTEDLFRRLVLKGQQIESVRPRPRRTTLYQWNSRQTRSRVGREGREVEGGLEPVSRRCSRNGPAPPCPVVLGSIQVAA